MTNTYKPNRLADMLFNNTQILLSTRTTYQPIYIKRNFDYSWRVYLGEPEQDLFCEPLYIPQQDEAQLNTDYLKSEVYRAVQVITDRIQTHQE